MFGPKRDEVAGEWRRLHDEELYALYSSLNIIEVTKSKRMRWAGHVARVKKRRGSYRVLVRKSTGRRSLGRYRRRRKGNIKMDLREAEWEGMGWIDLARDKNNGWALVNAVMNLWIP